MKIVLATGGTGGHIYPALALAEYIIEQDSKTEILFIGNKDKMEAKIIPDAGFAFKGITSKGLTGGIVGKAKALLIFVNSVSQAKKILQEFKPDVVIGFGGYVTGSIVYAAKQLKIRSYICELDSVAGKANLMLAKYVDGIFVSYENIIGNLPKEKRYLLGNPRASQIIKLANCNKTNALIKKGKQNVLIVMGSLGSETINEIMINALSKVENNNQHIIYVTGKKHYNEVSKQLISNDNLSVVPYIDDMPTLLKDIDLIVCRAGASTIAEITSIGVCAILIPSPYVTHNHQEHNAKALESVNACIVIKEKDLNAKTFMKQVNELLNDSIKKEALKINAKKLGKPDACEKMYDIIKLGR